MLFPIITLGSGKLYTIPFPKYLDKSFEMEFTSQLYEAQKYWNKLLEII